MELRNLEMMLERQVGVLKDIKEFVDKYGDSIAEDMKNTILDYVASVENPWNATYEACKAVVAEKREQEKAAEDKSKAKSDKTKPVRKKNIKEPEKEADDEDWSFLGDE